MVLTGRAGVQLEVDELILQRYTISMADSYITDPDILAQLDAPEESNGYVTDPDLLKQLDIKEKGDGYVSDPSILNQLDAPEPEAPRPGVADLRRSDEREIAASQKPVPTYDPNAQSSYRHLVSKYLGTSTTAQEMSGNDPSTYQKIKGGLNELSNTADAVAQALKDSGGDIDKAIELAGQRQKSSSQRLDATAAFGSPFATAFAAMESSKQSPAAERLTELKDELNAAKVPSDQHSRVIADAAKAHAWTENDSDNLRKLSTGELALNPGRVFGDKDKLVAEINASDTSPKDKADALKNLDARRVASAEKLANDLYYGDTRLPGATEFRDFQAAEETAGRGGDTSALLDKWITQQQNRGVGWQMIDGLMAGVAKGELGIAKTVVGGLAGAAALTGAPGAETLATGQQTLSATLEDVSKAEKLRGANGITNDLADTITQMAPMFAGGLYAEGLSGVAQTVVQGMSVYGWAAAQGYESKLDDAVSLARERKGADLTPQEMVTVLGKRETQIAAFANGFQTAVLSKVLGEGVERAALGKAAESMTVMDFIRGGVAKALRDGTLKAEIKEMGKTVLADASDESMEEFTNQVLDEAISIVALGKNMKFGDLVEESLKSGALGGLVGGATPQIRRTPDVTHAKQVAADIAPVMPQSANELLEMAKGTVLGTDGNFIVPDVVDPASGLTLDSQAQASLNTPNDNEQLAANSQLQVPVPAVPGGELAADPASKILAPESAAASSDGPPPPLNNENPLPETPAITPATTPEPVPAEEAISEGVPAAEIQPTSGGPAVAGSEEVVTSTPVTRPENVLQNREEINTSAKATSRQKLLAELGSLVDPGFPDKVQVGNSVIELTPDGDKIKVSISTPKNLRGGKSASKAMQKLVDLARRDGVTLDLDVEPMKDMPMSKEQLTAWYAGLGFKNNGDGTMTLEPGIPEASDLMKQVLAAPGGPTTYAKQVGKFAGQGMSANEREQAQVEAAATELGITPEPPALEFGSPAVPNLGENESKTPNPLIPAEEIKASDPTAPQPYSVESLKTSFDLTDEQAVVADAIGKALGAKVDLVAKGGTPSSLQQDNKASFEITESGKILLRGLQNPDFSSAVHEIAHAARRSMDSVLDPKEVATVEQWAGVKKDGKWGRYSEEKWARAWERYFREGKAPQARLQATFDKIAGWMAEVYRRVKGSEIDVEITPKVRAVMDTLAGKLVDTLPAEMVSLEPTKNFTQTPDRIQTPAGAMFTEDGSDLPPSISYTPENIDKIGEAATPEEAMEQFAGVIRGLLEQQSTPPPAVDAPTDAEWNPEGLYSLQERRSLEEAEQYGLDRDWKQARRTFGALWQHAVDTESKHVETGTAGTAFLDRFAMEGDWDRVLKDWEVALLTHEGLKRKMDVQRTLNTLIRDTVTGGQDAIHDADVAHKEALAAYQAIHNIAAGARTASGRALNAWKYALREDFSYATLYTQHLTRINAARKQQTPIYINELSALWKKWTGRSPKANGLVTELPAKEQEALLNYSEKQEARATEIALLTSKLEGKDTLIEEQKAFIAELRAKKKANRSKSAVSEVTKKTFLDRVSKSAAEARERLAAASAILQDDSNILFQAASNSVDPLWGDRVLVLAESLLREPNMTDARFEALVKLRFGDLVAAAAVDLRKDTEAHLRETMEDVTGVHVPTPRQVLNGIASDTKVTREIVIDLARAHIYEGARDSEIIDRVTESLGEVFPEIERAEVAQLFTRYGEISEKTPDELKKALDNARSLELVQKQIENLESSGVMKRTGRAKQEASDKLLALRKKRTDLAKEMGYNPVDPNTQLSSPQTAAKRRMANEIKELENALESGIPRERVRRGVDYTPDMDAMRDELVSLRKTYEETFGQERTPEEVNRMLAKDLDRRVAVEESLIERGLLSEPEVAKAAFIESAEVSARRQKLSDLRQQKRDNYEAAHPGETALKQAKDAAQKAVQKRLDVLSGNAPAAKEKKKRGEGVPPDQDIMRLWKAADAMTDYIAEIRRRRPLTPEQQQKRLDASYDTAVATRENLRRRIKQGDILPAEKTLRFTNARNEAVQNENAALRKQLLQMQKDAKVGPYDQVALEAKRFANMTKRLSELVRKKIDKDYAQKPRTEPTTSERIRALEMDTFLAKMYFETDRAKAVFESLGVTARQISRLGAIYQSRMMFNLTGDFGVVDRQLGKTNVFLVVYDLKKMWAKFKAGEKVKLSETMVADTLLKSYRSFLDEDDHNTLYHDMVTDPRYAFHKKNGFRLLNPHDTSHELNAEGQVRLNPMTVLSDRFLAALMIGKGLVKIGAGVATGGWAWKTGMKGVAETVLGVATAIYGRKAAIRIERANTTILNVARLHILETALALPGAVDPSISPDYAKDVTIGVMTYTGQTAGTGRTSKFLKNNAYIVGGFISFPQYRWTNLQSVIFGPLARIGFGLSDQKRQAGKALATVHGYWLAGTAAKMMVSAALLGIWDDDDENSGTWGFGLVVNKNHPYFGCIKIGKTYIDMAAGARVWLSDAAQMLSGTVVDRKKLAQGVVEEQENSAWNRVNAADNFLNKILNSNLRTAKDLFIKKEFREGGDMSKMGLTNQFSTILDEVMMNLTLKEMENIYKEHGPVQGSQIFIQLLLGDNVTILENAWERAERKDKESEKYSNE